MGYVTTLSLRKIPSGSTGGIRGGDVHDAVLLGFAIEVDECGDGWSEGDGHNNGKHAVSPAPLPFTINGIHNLTRKPGINYEGCGEHGARESAPFERRQVGDDDVVGQVKPGAPDGDKDFSNDVAGDGPTGGNNDIPEYIKEQDQRVCVWTGCDVGDLRDKGFAHGTDDTCCN